jgi:hypothetical protein
VVRVRLEEGPVTAVEREGGVEEAHVEVAGGFEGVETAEGVTPLRPCPVPRYRGEMNRARTIGALPLNAELGAQAPGRDQSRPYGEGDAAQC